MGDHGARAGISTREQRKQVIPVSDPFSDRYWIDEFQVTEADLDHISDHIRETSQAHDLTALARRVVRGRLIYGPEASAPAQPTWAEDPSVRLWDPAKEWSLGDHAIVAVDFQEGTHRWYEPFVGEVIKIEADKVTVQIDALGEPSAYSTQAKHRGDLQKWRQFVENLVAARRGTKDIETQVEYVILEYGEHVVSQLLDALRADGRLVRLAGRWFLRELVVSPTEQQLAALAWVLVGQAEPQPTETLVPLARPPLATGDSGLFGLYLAMRDRPALFANADPGQRPRWVLAGPPPGSCTPRYAAYDPETYAVLCLPDQSASPEAVKRLWEVGLLKAVVQAL